MYKHISILKIEENNAEVNKNIILFLSFISYNFIAVKIGIKNANIK